MKQRIENLAMDQERALYGTADTEVVNCRFDGPAAQCEITIKG